MNRLVFINSLGVNYKGDFIYEFIFSSSDSVWGESWEAKPSNGYPKPPELKYITKVGQLTTEDVSLYLIQNSDFFGMYDSIDGVIALAWESSDSDDILIHKRKRLVFQYGESEESVENKIYERDIVLKWEKNLVIDETHES
jgi:hypothetical protein